MKKFLVIVSLAVVGAVAEPPAPYPPSGWRPSGPAFELPQPGQKQEQYPQTGSEYLPPIDPRNPPLPPVEFGVPDVSVQGLPPREDQRPLFQTSPITGQQYSGPNFNKDLKTLDENFRQSQYQQQQERYRELQRQRELEAAQAATNANRLPAPVNPRKVARTTTEAPTTAAAPKAEFDQNQEDILNDNDQQSENLKDGKVSVEVTKQNVQEYPGEFFLGSLAQIQLQPKLVAYQPISGAYVQPQGAPENQVAGFDAATHFAAFPSVLAQQQNGQPQYLAPNDQQVLVQQPIAQYQPTYQPQAQPQQDTVLLQAPAQFQPNFYTQPAPNTVAVQPQYQPLSQSPANSYQPAFQPNPDAMAINPQYQPTQLQTFQIQAQPVIYEPQLNAQPAQFGPGQSNPSQPGKEPKDTENDDDNDDKDAEDRRNQQQLYQQQPQYYQPQIQYLQPQEQFVQPGQINQPQGQIIPPQGQFVQPQGQFIQPQGQFAQPQGQFIQPQDQLVQPQGQFIQPQGQYVQPQGQFDQPQGQYVQPQGQFAQPQGQYVQPQGQYVQPQGQFIQQGQYQPQTEYIQPQGQFAQQNQDSLQSGLDLSKEGNDIDENDNEENDQEGATAVATAFGTRTQPRIQPQYGVPYPVPRVQASTTEAPVEESNDGPAIAQATAVSGRRDQSARLRSRRIRPVYAVDRSGRLVLAEQ